MEEFMKFIIQHSVYINRWREIFAPDVAIAEAVCAPEEFVMTEEAWAQYQGYYAEEDDLPFTYGGQSSYLSDHNWYVRTERPEGWFKDLGEPVAGCLRFS